MTNQASSDADSGVGGKAHPEVIFHTVHGSHLYGFAHAGSDRDTFTVTTSRRSKARQRTTGVDDQITVGVNRFLDLATSGAHQYVEALFSPYKEWADTEAARHWRTLLESVRIAGVSEKFERTIRNFSYGDFKRRRHACRLSLALAELRAEGRMNPALMEQDALWCTQTATLHEGEDLAMILGVHQADTLAF